MPDREGGGIVTTTAADIRTVLAHGVRSTDVADILEEYAELLDLLEAADDWTLDEVKALIRPITPEEEAELPPLPPVDDLLKVAEYMTKRGHTSITAALAELISTAPTARPHLIRFDFTDHPPALRIECPGNPLDDDCQTYIETDVCRCVDQDLDCSGCAAPEEDEVDHELCDNFDIDVPALGAPPCRTVPYGDFCGLSDYDIDEIIGEGPWPEDEYPKRARVSWEGGGEYPVLRPWGVPE